MREGIRIAASVECWVGDKVAWRCFQEAREAAAFERAAPQGETRRLNVMAGDWTFHPAETQGEAAIVDLEAIDRDAHAIPCRCGGYGERVDCTQEECRLNGCGRDRPGRECCARAFRCRVCQARMTGTADAPEMRD